MSTTVTYKGDMVATVDNETKILTTGGKFLESDILITDTPSGGGGAKEVKDINFIDYDGTIVESYTTTEWANVSTLPDNPSHTDMGLTAQGWNWTKTQIDNQLTNVGGKVWVGQMYTTVSGATEIDVEFPTGSWRSPYLRIGVNGTISIDWGDSSTPDTLTGTSAALQQTVRHIYTLPGSYTIKITPETGTTYGITAGSSSPANNYTLLSDGFGALAQNGARYGTCIKAIRVGAGALGNYAAFGYLYGLKYITLPNTFDFISNTSLSNIFYACRSLETVVLPSSLTLFPSTGTFQECYSLTRVSLPPTMTTLGTPFRECHSLVDVTVPYSVTSIGTYAFYNCYALREIYLPNGIATIASNAFYTCHSLYEVKLPNNLTSIDSSAFNFCWSLRTVTIPSGVTSVGATAFASNFGVRTYHFLPTSPPSFGSTNTFNNIKSDVIIYVPSASVNAYKAVANLSTVSAYIQGE